MKPTIIKYNIFYLKIIIFWDIRASPTVCHILFGISCVLSTYKKICQIKKSLSPTVWHNSLAKPNLTYIRNPERKTKLYLCPSTS